MGGLGSAYRTPVVGNCRAGLRRRDISTSSPGRPTGCSNRVKGETMTARMERKGRGSNSNAVPCIVRGARKAVRMYVLWPCFSARHVGESKTDMLPETFCGIDGMFSPENLQVCFEG
uniref:Uncharacterized protein n=1 Tax=Odontella aurita TaxID=265563 RepID=A0A7S4IKU3_9STRA